MSSSESPVESGASIDSTSDDKKNDGQFERMANAYRAILTEIGVDKNDEELLKTPQRAAKVMMHFTQGYGQELHEVKGDAVTHGQFDHMVIVRDIEMFSLCQHHLLPFFGKVSVGYMANDKVLGLSKLARIVDMFCRRLQVQERLTDQIATAIVEAIHPKGVAVIVEATHMCMVMRGVEKLQSKTITNSFLGVFLEDQKLSDRFIALATKH